MARQTKAVKPHYGTMGRRRHATDPANTGIDDSRAQNASIEAMVKAARGRGPSPDQVDLSDPEALRYWTSHLDATARTLKMAVVAVGPSPAAVRRWLNTRTPG